MKLIKKNIWNAYEKRKKHDAFLVTTNNTIKKNGALVMGRGFAKQVRDRFPGFDLEAAKTIQQMKRDGIDLLKTKEFDDEYGLAFFRVEDAIWGCFQVKRHFRDPANLRLIRASAKALKFHALFTPDVDYHVNFPGIGNGHLDRDDVLPLLEDLPDNIRIYELDGA